MEKAIREAAKKARPFLEPALKYALGTHTFDDVVDGLVSGEMQLWANDKAAVITEIQTYPRMKVCHFFLAGGDLNELDLFQRVIGQWAKSLGCTRLTLAGRRGWERSFLRGQGYSPKWSILSKEL